jgi:hypothetical protein
MLVPSRLTADETDIDSTDSMFDAGADPVWFSHITDTHISAIFPEHAVRLHTLLDYSQRHVHPALTILSGDLTDQLSSDSLLAKAAPMLDQWKSYREILDAYNLSYLEVLGNHDVWGLATETSSHAYCFEYTNRLPGPGRYCHTTELNRIRIVVFEPFDFPNPGPTTGYWIVLTEDMLNELEDVLYASTGAQFTILVAHHTSDTFWPQLSKSRNGRSFKDMMEKVDAFINGHLHPSDEPRIDHFGKTVEYTGLALRTHEVYQLITFDNRRIAYHVCKTDDEDLAVVTMPVPHKEVRSIGYQTRIAVRILAFSDREMTFYSSVSGEEAVPLERTRNISENVALYTRPLELEPGIYRLQISGDLQKEIEFAVRTKTESFTFPRATELNGWSLILVIVLEAVFYLLAFIGMFLHGEWAEPFKKAHNWYKGKTDESQWLISALLGPVVIGRNLRKAPNYCQIVILVLVLWGFTMPIGFFGLEGHVGIMWIFSFAVAGRIIPDVIMLLEAVTYLFLICPPFLNVLSLYDFEPDWSFIVDLLIWLGKWAAGQYFWFWFGAANAADYAYFASLEFFIFPICFIGFTIVIYAKHWMCVGAKPIQNEVLP